MTGDVHSYQSGLSLPADVTQPVDVHRIWRHSFSWPTFVAGVSAGAVLIGLVWLLIAVGGSSAPAASQPFTLKGTMVLLASGFGTGACHGTGGYSDIGEGASVTVYGASGTVVAEGELGAGQSSSYGRCVFPVTVTNVPGGEKFYQVEVSHRGKITVTAENARAGDVAISLGS